MKMKEEEKRGATHHLLTQLLQHTVGNLDIERSGNQAAAELRKSKTNQRKKERKKENERRREREGERKKEREPHSHHSHFQIEQPGLGEDGEISHEFVHLGLWWGNHGGEITVGQSRWDSQGRTAKMRAKMARQSNQTNRSSNIYVKQEQQYICETGAAIHM